MHLINHVKHMEIDTQPKTLRSFGLLLSLIILGFFAYYLFKHDVIYRSLLFAGGCIAIMSLILPTAIKVIYIPWMMIARLIGFVITQVILILFYFCIITPIGLLKRITGLWKKSTENPETYWINKDTTKPDMERMF